jgi:type II secretory pathway pseudopilin PulG
MVVIILISILAIMAVPAMKTARDDRMAFDYARQFQALIHRAEVRAMARGAAHLVILDRSGGTRGRATLFEAVDATPAALNGPKPVSSCRGQRDTAGNFINHWVGAQGWTPGAASPALSPIIENSNVDGPGVEAQMNLFITMTEQVAGPVPVIAVCYTPGGNVYVGTGANPSSAVTAMRIAPIYNRYFEIEMARHDGSSNPLGLKRRIIVAGGAAPRIVSQ